MAANREINREITCTTSSPENWLPGSGNEPGSASCSDHALNAIDNLPGFPRTEPRPGILIRSSGRLKLRRPQKWSSAIGTATANTGQWNIASRCSRRLTSALSGPRVSSQQSELRESKSRAF